MLKIRSEQLQELQNRVLCDQTQNYLEQKYPQKFGSLALEDRRLKSAEFVKRAQSYGLTWTRNVFAFAGLAVSINPQFHLHSKVQKILQDDKLDPDSKIQVLTASLDKRDWRKIRNNNPSLAKG